MLGERPQRGGHRLRGAESPDVGELRRRQAAGELAPDLDPALVLVMLQGAVSAGMLFATDVRDLAGLDPRSPEFLDRYGALLRRVVRGVAAPTD